MCYDNEPLSKLPLYLQIEFKTIRMRLGQIARKLDIKPIEVKTFIEKKFEIHGFEL